MTSESQRLARATRAAQRPLARATAETRSTVLERLHELLDEQREEVLAANQDDLDRANQNNLEPSLVKRLGLDGVKLETLKEGVRALATADDPLNRTLTRTLLDDGLILHRVTSPLGVLLVIFESRPEAVIQIGSLAIRSGNAVLLKGGSEARSSNRVLVDLLRSALADCGLDPDAIQNVEGREAASALLECDDEIDLVIPRGSGALVRSIQESTRIPVLGHAEGVCHLYLDAAASSEMATRLSVDGKCDYPAACNATETLLVHRDFLPQLGPTLEALRDAGVALLCDESSRKQAPWAGGATEVDLGQEWGDLKLTVWTVEDIDASVDHIHRYGSGHTDAICTDDRVAAEHFLAAVDSASVFHNASTRFADGFRYGLGAEVGISTSRIHARGPVGVEGLLTTRWLLRGHGQGASDYGPGRKTFKHQKLD